MKEFSQKNQIIYSKTQKYFEYPIYNSEIVEYIIHAGRKPQDPEEHPLITGG